MCPFQELNPKGGKNSAGLAYVTNPELKPSSWETPGAPASCAKDRLVTGPWPWFSFGQQPAKLQCFQSHPAEQGAGFLAGFP